MFPPYLSCLSNLYPYTNFQHEKQIGLCEPFGRQSLPMGHRLAKHLGGILEVMVNVEK